MAALNTTAHSEVKKPAEPAGGLRLSAGPPCTRCLIPRVTVAGARRSGQATPRTEPHFPLPGEWPVDSCASSLLAREETQKGRKAARQEGE